MIRRKKIVANKYLYVVKLVEGKSHPNYWDWLTNITEMNGKAPDFGGIQSLCVLSHSQDAATVHMLSSEGFNKANRNDVIVEEITKTTLESSESSHRLHTELIENYFLPYGYYPNIEE
jgi:hypothetical protein